MTTTFADVRPLGQAALFERLPRHVERLAWGPEELLDHQRRALRRVLAVARERSPFHAERLAGVDVAGFEPHDLPSLPTMTKGDVMDRWDDVVTDEALTLDLAEAALARTGAEPDLVLGRYLCLATGGSTGRRGVFVTDVEAQVEFGCALLRPMAARLAALGLPLEVLTIAMLGAPSAVHATGLGPALLEGSPIRMVPVPATLPLAEVVARLEDLAPNVLYGYPSVIARLAREQVAGRLRLAPLSVTCTSELLLDEHRRAIEEAFGVPVVDTFGSTEGLVGHAAPGDDGFTFASDLCIVEHVDGRVLVTNLFNTVQPLLRYELGDRFVPLPSTSHQRARVEGRADDVLRWGGVEVHPIAVRAVLLHEPAVVDYQARQTSGGLDIDVVTAGPVDAAAVAAGVAEALERAGLERPTVAVRVVPGLAGNGATGKLRRFVPLPA